MKIVFTPGSTSKPGVRSESKRISISMAVKVLSMFVIFWTCAGHLNMAS